jgi:perosamine synthetase
MRIGRTLPPAATPIYPKDILSGLKGIIRGSKEINRFESELKEYYNVKHCFLVSSGKAALTIILKALHELHPERNEVLIPAFTCYSVPSAIIKAGLKIKLCDINPDTLDFDFDQLKETFTNSNLKSSILAVLPTHLFGIPADIDQIKEIMKNSDLPIIEDAAQAMGGTLKEKKLGTLGDAGFFSLGRGKAFSTVEGGIILTNNNSIADNITQQMKSIPSYNIVEIIKLVFFSIILSIFMHPAFFWFPKSIPFLKLGETIFDQNFSIKKISSFQAGLARNWQQKLIKLTKIRRKNTSNWINSFSTNLFNSKLPLLRFPLKIENKQILDTILSKSENQGLGIIRSYPDSINNIKELKKYFINKTYLKATMISEQLLTLPVHNYVSLSDSFKIKKIIPSCLCARIKFEINKEH